jgi:hypothetical protein
MIDLIFWLVVAAYWAIGIKRISVYFHRVYQSDRDSFSSIHTESDSHKAAAWGALGLASIWPYYEGGRWLRDHIINTMTAEQRRQQEYEKATKIVADYKAKQEREAREAFDRELRGDGR